MKTEIDIVKLCSDCRLHSIKEKCITLPEHHMKFTSDKWFSSQTKERKKASISKPKKNSFFTDTTATLKLEDKKVLLLDMRVKVVTMYWKKEDL